MIKISCCHEIPLIFIVKGNRVVLADRGLFLSALGVRFDLGLAQGSRELIVKLKGRLVLVGKPESGKEYYGMCSFSPK